jgi:putative SOS response-associated peptidase YedK
MLVTRKKGAARLTLALGTDATIMVRLCKELPPIVAIFATKNMTWLARRSKVTGVCYSAQVVQVVRKLHRQLGIRLDYQEAERLFFRRLEEPSLMISRGFESNFEEPANDQERRIKGAIDEHRSRLATKLERDLFSQKTRLTNAQRSLEAKETKKFREEVRIATSKIETLTSKMSDLRRTETQSQDNRIFPMVYTGVIIREEGENVLTPMRYFCRPAGKPAVYDKKYPGLYNARRDNLEKFWGEQFGSHHAVMCVESFYENVQRHALERRELRSWEAGENVVLQFTPEPMQTLLIACVWSDWREPGSSNVRGFAAITDEPPADVAAAGHDRCIVNIKPEHVEAWLTPSGRSRTELQAILSDREIPVIRHEALQAA